MDSSLGAALFYGSGRILGIRLAPVRFADHPAAVIEDAGGRVTNFAGGPFELSSREVLSSNGLLHDALMHEFREIFAGRELEPLPDPRAYSNQT